MTSVRAMFAALLRTVKEFLDDSPMDMAGALSYYTLLSIAPTLLVIIAAAGLILDEAAVQEQLVAQISGLVGSDSAQFIETAIAGVAQQERGVLALVIGIAIIVVGATTVFAQLQTSFNRIWRVETTIERGAIWSYLRQRLLSLGMVLAIAFLLLVSLGISALLAGLQGVLGEYLPGLPVIWRALNLVVSLGLITALFAMMFKFLPDAKTEWRDVWFGAFITSLLFTAGKFVIGLYLGQASVGSAYGAAGSVVVLMIWIYYASLILFFGAKITYIMARQRGAKAARRDHTRDAT